MRRHDFETLLVAGVLVVLVVLMLAAIFQGGVAYPSPPPVIGGLVLPVDELAQVGSPLAAISRAPIHPLPGYPMDPEPEEAQLVFTAAHQCSLATVRHFKPEVALQMLRAEEAAGIGEGHPLRGNSLAAWCGEAAYMIHDDICKTGSCDGGSARGVLQLHVGYARMCVGLPYRGPDVPEADALRDDPERSVRCFLQHVLRVWPRSIAACKGADAWYYAELWIAKGSRPASCKDISGHVARLLDWRKS